MKMARLCCTWCAQPGAGTTCRLLVMTMETVNSQPVLLSMLHCSIYLPAFEYLYVVIDDRVLRQDTRADF